jgi:hypothetical protein
MREIVIPDKICLIFSVKTDFIRNLILRLGKLYFKTWHAFVRNFTADAKQLFHSENLFQFFFSKGEDTFYFFVNE